MCDPEFRTALAATATRSTRRPARSTSSPSTSGRSARGPRRSAATSTATRPSGAPTHPGAGTRPAAAAGVGPPGLGRGPPRQGRPHATAPSWRERWRGGAARARVTRRAAPRRGRTVAATPVGGSTATAVVETVLARLGARRSAWNAADIRGEVERLIAAAGVVTERRGAARAGRGPHRPRRRGLRAAAGRATDVPEHVRALTSREVLEVEADLTTRLAARADVGRSTDRWSTRPSRTGARMPPSAGRGRRAGRARRAGGGRGRGRGRQDHHPGRRPRRCSSIRGIGWWW